MCELATASALLGLYWVCKPLCWLKGLMIGVTLALRLPRFSYVMLKSWIGLG